MEDINKAGGVNAVMKEMTKRVDNMLLENLTISGETVLEKIKDAYIKDTDIIHELVIRIQKLAAWQFCTVIWRDKVRLFKRLELQVKGFLWELLCVLTVNPKRLPELQEEK